MDDAQQFGAGRTVQWLIDVVVHPDDAIISKGLLEGKRANTL